ncbi:MAG: hypothetical protein OER85_10865 [Gammaproteobacteria bacterium]|jgi:hypothetical protein|nr:hypothetical protein [Gammaproteobacteria bacterium]
MKRIHRIIGNRCISAVGLSLLMLAPPAWAYLDPSTGSMILSAIVGLFATLALAVKTYWYKLKSLFRRHSQQKSAPLDESAAEPESSADR